MTVLGRFWCCVAMALHCILLHCTGTVGVLSVPAAVGTEESLVSRIAPKRRLGTARHERTQPLLAVCDRVCCLPFPSFAFAEISFCASRKHKRPTNRKSDNNATTTRPMLLTAAVVAGSFVVAVAVALTDWFGRGHTHSPPSRVHVLSPLSLSLRQKQNRRTAFAPSPQTDRSIDTWQIFFNNRNYAMSLFCFWLFFGEAPDEIVHVTSSYYCHFYFSLEAAV